MRSNGLGEEDHIHQEEDREENADRPEHVAEEGRHLNAAFIADRNRHEIRCVADVAHRPHEDRPHRNSHQRLSIRGHKHFRITARQIEEGEVRRRIVKER